MSTIVDLDLDCYTKQVDQLVKADRASTDEQLYRQRSRPSPRVPHADGDGRPHDRSPLQSRPAGRAPKKPLGWVLTGAVR